MSLSDSHAFVTGRRVTRRAACLLLTGAALAACGFTPVHAPGGTGAALRGQVAAAAPQTRADFAFVAALEDRLGRATAPRYQLGYTIMLRRIGGADVRDLGDTRFQLAGTLDYRLTETGGGTQVASGRVDSTAAYSSTSTQLATLSAAEDAEARLMRILADQLVPRLMIALDGRAP
ncbi:LPS assembly lipoprotein LptE [Roseicitreum antarcticum]|uniref:LPS-assembly lipoprotein n=1 Tax=Roseicitreum antarcticum TaxID=564137 RepID=A0A1H3AKY2_9RHOB|nr:LPS assembly lipoprotein LptE [Roseicitreum antarcticum]SDX30370.1 LPS-assembly lipoprotein [Roseicitreum antarcticum]